MPPGASISATSARTRARSASIPPATAARIGTIAICHLVSYDLTGREGFRGWGVLAVDRSPYYAKRAAQFDAMATGVDGTIFIGESDRRASLFLFLPGGQGFPGGLNPSNPR